MNPNTIYQKFRRQFLLRAHDTEWWASYQLFLPSWLYGAALMGSGFLAAAFSRKLSKRPWLQVLVAICGILLWLPVVLFIGFTWQRQARRTAVCQQILDSIYWRGDENVLDVGCGSGMLLNGAAARLKTGQATGIDIWADHGGGGNLDLLLKHARREQVTDRIIFQEVDARDMPFEDASFDIVLSSWAMHHMCRSHADFEDVSQEMLRVLKPEGTIVILDIEHMLEAFKLKMEKAGLTVELKDAPYKQKLLIGKKL